MNNLRPYAMEDWFLAMTPEQRVVYETRIGSLCGDGLINQAAHWIAYKEAMEAMETVSLQ